MERIEVGARLTAARTRLGLRSNAELAGRLHVGTTVLVSWLDGRRAPPKKYWGRLIRAGVATQAELTGLQTARPKRYSLRGARFYRSLDAYAAAGGIPAAKAAD